MPLELLLALVAGGISAIAVILHLSGRSERAVLTTETARKAWLRHCPGDSIRDVLPAAGGHAALVAAQSGPGLVWAFGADTVARHLHAAAVSPSPAGLRFDFKDFSAPALSLALTGTERAHWQALIAAAAQEAV
ncbi:hypothetical protein [Leisingera sp. MMG026]|uniref:hypothetical protein n=1 Tax=Leisingera sp. MMG026 TaxID=2909982 RepID=UPI001F1EF8E9|nr:hypothetical protein [Leisingera sp. MMG026]MCF6430832.1 hypothetical protein [Leisingera sp. MMG026]